MGQAVKYAALGVAIVSILALVAGVISLVQPNSLIYGFALSVQSVVDSAGDFFRNVRGALNFFMGPMGAVFWNIAIAFWVGIPLARIAYKVVIAVTRFLNQ